MGTDDLFKKRKGKKKKRKEQIREMQPYRYLIVCEGKKTEPKYFEGIKRKIDKKYRDRVVVNKINLDIKGLGKNTETLVEDALKFRSLSKIPYGHVWVIFDKDDFSDQQFNSAVYKAIDNDLKVGWSNESIELWFLLHFEYLNTALQRYQYIEKLSQYFSQNNISNGTYEKNLDDIFEILCEYGDIEEAISRGKKLEELYCSESEAKRNPCTTVYKLVEELIDYIK